MTPPMLPLQNFQTEWECAHYCHINRRFIRIRIPYHDNRVIVRSWVLIKSSGQKKKTPSASYGHLVSITSDQERKKGRRYGKRNNAPKPLRGPSDWMPIRSEREQLFFWPELKYDVGANCLKPTL